MLRALAVLAFFLPALAFGQSVPYPTRLVRIIVPFPGGGTADAVTRIVAEKLSERWGQPVIIDNRPGAGGNIGAEQFSHAAPDGYTLMSSPPGPIAINESLERNLRYEASKFVPVTILATSITVLDVRPDLGVNSVQDLIHLAKQRSRKLAYASQGYGSTSHLTAAMFQQQAGIEMLHVPYKSSPSALTDLMGGQIDLFFDNISTSLAMYRAGKIRILAVASLERTTALPEIPTISESGLPGFRSVSWNALVAPENVPPAIAETVNRAVTEVLKLPDVREKYAKLSAEPVGNSLDQARTFIIEERARWKKVIGDAQVKVD